MTVQDATEKLKKRGHSVRTLPGPDGNRYAIDDFHYTGTEVIFLVEQGLKPGTQLWSRVVLNSDVPEMQARGLIDSVQKTYLAERLPEGVEIYRAPAAGGFLYYFSPQAAGLIPKGVERTPCIKPDRTHMRRVEL
jgi:hypothetical protein